MAIDNTEVIDGIAYEEEKLILQLYDHWEFTDEIEKDHKTLPVLKIRKPITLSM